MQQSPETAKDVMVTDNNNEETNLTEENLTKVDATDNPENDAIKVNVEDVVPEVLVESPVNTDSVIDAEKDGGATSGLENSENTVFETADLKEPAKEEVTISFEDFGLDSELLSAVTDLGYKTPTPIQAKAIPEVLKGRDVLGIAQTGTGKTASFVLPMLEILSQGRAKARMPRTIILEPTRELAAQVAENFEKYGKNKKINMALLIGGVAFGDQDALLMKGVDVLIATPGRLLDQFERGKILMSGVQMLVIDEADRMLDMGFIPDIERVAKLVPFTRQTLFFSATMPKEIEDLATQFLQAPVRIEVARPNQTAATIEQFIVKTPYNDAKLKRTILRNLIREEGDKVHNAIVFCNRKRDVDIVSKSLTKHGIPAAAIHGDLQQSQRMAVLEDFKSGKIKTLVASDVAARGIDVAEVSHVFNYDVPSHAEDYVHRIGRTGRAGRSGLAYMIVTPYDEKHLEAVEDLIKKKIDVVSFDVGQNNEPVKDFDRHKKDNKRPDKNPHHSEDKKHHNRKREDRPSYNKTERENEVIVGFGDNIPAFMMAPVIIEEAEAKPVKKPATRKKTTSKRTKKSETKTDKIAEVTDVGENAEAVDNNNETLADSDKKTKRVRKTAVRKTPAKRTATKKQKAETKDTNAVSAEVESKEISGASNNE